MLVLAPACTTGVNDGFDSFTSTPAQTAGPSVTTFDTDSAGSSGNDADDDDDSQGTGSGDDVSDTTMGPSTATGPGTTTSSEECVPPCPAGEMCILGACEPIGGTTTGAPGCNEVPGNYDVCLGPGNVVDTSGCGDPGTTCITGGEPVIAGVCSVTPCVDACDCPAAPPTGSAVVTCDAITGGPDNFCYLDCSLGQACPTGMVCFADTACIWPGEGANGVPYGDCFNNGQSTCGLDGICLNDNVMAPTVGVCTEPCVNVGECPGSPGGTAPVVCQDVTGDMMNECTLDCSLGGSCPAGMTCFSGFLCMWN